MPHLLGNVDNIIKSDIFTVLNVSLLPSVLWRFFEGLDDKSGGRGSVNLGLCVLNDQFHCNPQTIPISVCFDDVITNLFWKQTQGPILVAKTDMAPTSPLLHLRYVTLNSLESNFCLMVEVASVGWTGIQDYCGKLYLGFLQTKGWKNHISFFHSSLYFFFFSFFSTFVSSLRYSHLISHLFFVLTSYFFLFFLFFTTLSPLYSPITYPSQKMDLAHNLRGLLKNQSEQSTSVVYFSSQLLQLKFQVREKNKLLFRTALQKYPVSIDSLSGHHSLWLKHKF